MIQSEEYFPQYLNEIDTSHTSYWRKHNCYFWHETKLLNKQNFKEFQQKYSHIKQNFNKISNVQNNLAKTKIQNLSSISDLRGIKDLIKTINSKFNSPNKFIVVSNKSKMPENSFADDLENLASVYYLDQDMSIWKGDDCAWSLLFKSTFDKV
jgi:hypothetical protein